MDELQDALDWVDSGPVVVGAKHINELAKAARRYANPNIKAAADRGYEVFHLNVLIELRQLVKVNKALRMAVEAAVAAALTPGDTENE